MESENKDKDTWKEYMDARKKDKKKKEKKFDW